MERILLTRKLETLVRVGILTGLIAVPGWSAPNLRLEWDGSPFPDLKYSPSVVDAEETKYRFESFGWLAGATFALSPSSQVRTEVGYGRRTLVREVLADRSYRLPTLNLYTLAFAAQWTRESPDGSWLGQISIQYGVSGGPRPLTPTGMR